MTERWMVVKRCCDMCPPYGAVTEVTGGWWVGPLGSASSPRLVMLVIIDNKSYPEDWLQKMPPDEQVRAEEAEEAEREKEKVL